MTSSKTATILAALAAIATTTSAAEAAMGDPSGIWFAHNGRGAVEIKECDSGSGYCGFVVHLKNASDGKRCGQQILGNVTAGGGGWVYSPERGRRYDVALTRLSDDKLRVVGNAGSRFFSRTYTWNRAPDDIERCGEETAAAPAETETETATETTAETPAEEAAPAKTTKKVKKAKAEKTEEALPSTKSGSAALMIRTSVQEEEEPVPAEDKPAAKEKPAKAAKKDKPVKTATVEEAPAEEETSGGGGRGERIREIIDDFRSGKGKGKGDCKYKIPYVGRTISVPCR